MTTNCKKILFAPIFENHSIIKTYIEEKPFEEIVLFADETKRTNFQLKSIDYVKKLLNQETIKILEIPKYNVEKTIEMLEEYINNYKDKKLYFDISHGHKMHGYILMTYLMLKNPSNLEKIIYYSKEDNSIVNLPIFQIKNLNQIEIQILQLCAKEQINHIQQIQQKLNHSTDEILINLNNLKKQSYIKINDTIKLRTKGRIYLKIKEKNIPTSSLT